MKTREMLDKVVAKGLKIHRTRTGWALANDTTGDLLATRRTRMEIFAVAELEVQDMPYIKKGY